MDHNYDDDDEIWEKERKQDLPDIIQLPESL